MELTKDQKQLIYSALLAYGNRLSDMAKEIPNEIDVTSRLTSKADKAWILAIEFIKN